MRLNLLAVASLVLPVLACTSDAVTPPPESPFLTVTSPERGLMQSGLASVAVQGTVTPSASGSPISKVEVNGNIATVAPDGAFSVIVPLQPGANFLETKVVAEDGGAADDTRGVITGRFQPFDTTIVNSLSAALSKEAFATLAETAATLVETTDLNALVMPMNPVVAKGLSNGQEDCLYGKVSVRPGLDMTTADIAIVPNDNGLALDVSLHGLYIPLHARYAAACLDGDTDITIRATTARIRGTVEVTAVDGRYDVKLVGAQVTFVGFDLQASGVPGAVLSLLDLNNSIAGVLSTAVEKFVGPMVQQAIAGVHIGPQTLAVLGKDVTVEVGAAGVGFDTAGAEMVLDSKITVGGSNRKFYFTDDQVPPPRGDAGFQLAVADDTVNQLLAGFWGAGGFNLTIPKALGNYDAITLEAKLPPIVTAGADGTLQITMPDLIAHMTNRGDDITVLAMNVSIGLKVTPNPVNANLASLTIQPPVIRADVISDVTGMPDESIENLMPFMIEHMMGQFTPLLAVVPLPAVMGIRLSELNVGTTGSYVTVSGSIR